MAIELNQFNFQLEIKLLSTLTLPDLGRGGGRADPSRGFSSITLDRDKI